MVSLNKVMRDAIKVMQSMLTRLCVMLSRVPIEFQNVTLSRALYHVILLLREFAVKTVVSLFHYKLCASLH